MTKNIAKKANLVTELTDTLQKSAGFMVFTYLGLDGQEVTNLRKDFATKQGRLKVVQNNILNRSLAAMQITQFGTLDGPNALVYGADEPLGLFQAIVQLQKDHPFLQIKGSYVENQFLDPNQTVQLAKIGSKPNLLTMLLACFTDPIRSLLYALTAVSEQKANATE